MSGGQLHQGDPGRDIFVFRHPKGYYVATWRPRKVSAEQRKENVTRDWLSDANGKPTHCSTEAWLPIGPFHHQTSSSHFTGMGAHTLALVWGLCMKLIPSSEPLTLPGRQEPQAVLSPVTHCAAQDSKQHPHPTWPPSNRHLLPLQAGQVNCRLMAPATCFLRSIRKLRGKPHTNKHTRARED